MHDPNTIPGLRKRRRADGSLAWYWIASEVSRKTDGFGLKTVRLIGDDGAVRARAQTLTAELREWLAGRLIKSAVFTGKVTSLIDCYLTDEDSPYRSIKANTRRQYDESLAIIRATVGAAKVGSLTRKDFSRWHRGFRYPVENGPERLRRAGHAIKLVRIIMNYGASMRFAGCAETAAVLHNMRFELPERRTKELTYEQASAIVDEAIKRQRPSVALAQAMQFELQLRQKDVIGEWTMRSAADGATAAGGIVKGGWLWSGGARWSDVTPDGVLVKKTTKTGTLGEWRLDRYPLIQRALAAFPAEARIGAMITAETDGYPYRADRWRIVWREIATAVGVPLDIWNMDSRAGGITEGDEAGATIHDMQLHATHSNPTTTGRYIRRTRGATERVADLRVKHRSEKNGA